jgi:hypothetical protein
MSSTLDNICDSIDLKFSTLISIFNEYDKIVTDDSLKEYINELNILHSNYITNTVDILKKYYDSTNDSELKYLRNQFIKTYHGCNVVGDMDRLYNICKKLRKNYDLSDSLNTLHKNYESIEVDEEFINTGADYCSNCNLQYSIEEKTAEYICKQCGKIEKMAGVVFEDDQFYYQEGKRTKHGKYDPIKHAKFWLDRIQAKESTNIPDDVINAIKRCIYRDQQWADNITCETIRTYLKQLKLTMYNNHTALILKMIKGVEPEQLTEIEVRLIYMYFGTVIQIFNKIKNPEKSNCPYHPYFIYKIIEQIIKSPYDRMRRDKILSCIHLQARDTLIDNDITWFAICDHIPEFTKIATNKCKTRRRK